MLIALSGLLAGTIHVVSGPDHLSAIAPIAFNKSRRSWTAGLLWGLGHASGVLAIGIALLWMREQLPLAALSSVSDRIAGCLLVGIGLFGLRRALRIHTHEHSHGGESHHHLHTHAGHSADSHSSHSHAAFFVGSLHGIAGSSHAWAILPAIAMVSLADSFTYLFTYCLGTVLAMSCFSAVISWLAAGLADRGRLLAYRVVLLMCSATAALIGTAFALAK